MCCRTLSSRPGLTSSDASSTCPLSPTPQVVTNRRAPEEQMCPPADGHGSEIARALTCTLTWQPEFALARASLRIWTDSPE